MFFSRSRSLFPPVFLLFFFRFRTHAADCILVYVQRPYVGTAPQRRGKRDIIGDGENDFVKDAAGVRKTRDRELLPAFSTRLNTQTLLAP